MARTDAVVVCDAGPLIHLGELAAVDLLADFEHVFVPDQVWVEVDHHFPAVLTQSKVKLTRRSVNVLADARFRTIVHAFALDLGEQAALSLMAQFPDAILLTDDTAARLAAQSLGYRIHGTLGLIVRTARRGQRKPEAVVDLLRAVPQHSTLHVRPALLEQVIAQVRKAYDIS